MPRGIHIPGWWGVILMAAAVLLMPFGAFDGPLQFLGHWAVVMAKIALALIVLWFALCLLWLRSRSRTGEAPRRPVSSAAVLVKWCDACTKRPAANWCIAHRKALCLDCVVPHDKPDVCTYAPVTRREKHEQAAAGA